MADCEVADGVAWQAGVPDGGGVAGESGLAGFEEPFVAEAVCGEAGLESDVGPVLDFGEVNEQVAYEFELCSFDVAFVGAGHVVFEGDGQVAAGPGE